MKKKSKCSDELCNKIKDMLNNEIMTMSLHDKTTWLHVLDAVDKGNISPMEVYDALELGYVPEHLLVRESRYLDHLEYLNGKG